MLNPKLQNLWRILKIFLLIDFINNSFRFNQLFVAHSDTDVAAIYCIPRYWYCHVLSHLLNYARTMLDRGAPLAFNDMNEF